MTTYRPISPEPWTVYPAEIGKRYVATNGRARIFLVRGTREEAERALRIHRERNIR